MKGGDDLYMEYRILYNRKQVCEELNICEHTLSNWYYYERKLLKENPRRGKRLPDPIKIANTKGNPNYWDEEGIEKLREFQKNLPRGRKGEYGKFTNPYYKGVSKENKE